jgi:4-amino-4-deoxy-L-arabinose transferase-like glycosyltransferase
MLQSHWLRLGYVFIGAVLLFRLAYLGSGKIELSEDEAYQWVWSKHLALSYYSKPPLIAYIQFLGTSLWGDTEFGVRFFSPLIAAVIGVLLLRFFACAVDARAGFWLLLILTATPLLAVGATLMTIDPLSVLFWTAAMLTGWYAVRRDSTRQWLWTGLWMGLGFLSKYTALFQLLCWAVFFALCKPARVELRRPGPYLAVLVLAVCALPVLIWNWQHDWITVSHLANRGGLQKPWEWQRSASFLRDFLLAETALLNPVFFLATVLASFAFWKERPRDPLLLFLFSMGAPLFLFYAAYTLRARVLPNWIAPAVLPLFCLMLIYWYRRWKTGIGNTRPWFVGGVVFGLVAVILMHDTNLIAMVAGRPLPPRQDPLNRVRGWRETARVVGQAREKLIGEGKPVIVIGDHYGITGLLSFYMAEAKRRVVTDPLVYYQSSDAPENQFFFWQGYLSRHGENAIFVQTSKEPSSAPARIQTQFASVTDLGVTDITYRGRVIHRIQLFECRGLR